MISTYDYLVIGVYLALLASMGWIFRRFNRGSADYFAGGFRMTWWLLGASSFISNFSCWLFTGAANIAYTYGVLILGFFAIDVISFAIGYWWFGPRIRQLRLVTGMDAVRQRFGRGSEQFFTWLFFVSSLGLAAVWMVSLAVILSSVFRFPPGPVILATGGIVVLIALLGGSWAVVASDFVQLLALLCVTLAVSGLTLFRLGGLHAFLAQVPSSHWQFFHPAGSIPYDWLYLVAGLGRGAYMRNNAAFAGKYIPAKDGAHARRSALIPLIGYLIMPLVWFIPPLAAFTLAPDLSHQVLVGTPGEAAYVVVALRVLPRGLVGLFIAGMFSATIASMDVALNKNAGFFVKNFYQPLFRPRAGERELVAAGEGATVLFGAVITGGAWLLAVASHVTLFDDFLYMGAYLGVPLSVPMFLGLLCRRTPPWSGWATTVCGMATTLFLYLFVPSAAGAALLRPLLGPAFYGYLVTNKFVGTDLISVPLMVGFFLATRWWVRGPNPAVDEFFTRMRTPVDFEREVGADNTARQASLLGRITCGYGAFILLLLLIPNPLSGRVAILGCAGTLALVGAILLGYARRARAD